MYTLMENIKTLLEASREVGLEINTVKIKYMVLYHHQNAGKIAIYWLQ
jgi:hypothetical protein